MKILVISNYHGLHTARPEAEIFIGLQQLGHDITIMTYPDADYIPRFESHDIKVIPIHPIKKYDSTFLKHLHTELDKGYDILQLYNNKAITNGIRAAKLHHTKVVIYRGASANMAWYNPFNYLKFFHPRIDYAICNSEEIRQNFLAVPFSSREKAVTIHKGHDAKWYSRTEPYDIRSELRIPDNHLIFVLVANNRKVKAVPDLLKAMNLITSQSKISLLIIGHGMDTKELSNLIEVSPHEENIHLLGFRKEALSIVASCDVFVLTSVSSESLTKSVIEAMSLGVVPLITDIAGNRPLVDDGINGLTFRRSDPDDLASKMTYLCQNAHILPELGANAKQKIQRELSAEKTVKEYDEFYRKIVD